LISIAFVKNKKKVMLELVFLL